MSDAFNYLTVLVSIILGLAITQVLKGFRGILLTRAHVKMYWPSVAWGLLLLLIFFQSWWALFSYRGIATWTFQNFFIVLLENTLKYMLAALVFPDFFGGDIVDLRKHYFEHARWFFGIMIAVLLVSLAKDVIIGGHLTDVTNLVFHVVFVASAIGGAVIRRDGYHKSMVLFGIALFLFYIFELFVRLK